MSQLEGEELEEEPREDKKDDIAEDEEDEDEYEVEVEVDVEDKDIDWGWPKVYVENAMVSVIEFLGEGSSAEVFQGRFEGKDVVLKLFKDDEKSRLATEHSVLKRLESEELLGRVPEVVAVSDDKRCLILAPIGQAFPRLSSEVTNVVKELCGIIPKTRISSDIMVMPTYEHFEAIVDTLIIAHAKGVLHCDVALTNCFHLPSSQIPVLLSDWGHSKLFERTKGYKRFVYFGEGTLCNASLSVLSQLEEAGKRWKDAKVKVCPADDLGSVACMVFHALHPATYAAILGIRKPALLLRFWRHVFSLAPWQKMAEAAAAYDHELLKRLISNIIESHGHPWSSCSS